MWEIIPNPGKIRIYTSGWPKNQNKCWYRIGSPPPLGSKKDVLKFRSVKSIVIAPAKTGKERRRRMVVIKTDQINRGIRSRVRSLIRIFMIVVIKLIDPRIDEIPAIWRLKIAKSTAFPLWEILLDRGGYTVQPVPTPLSIKELKINKIIAGNNNQKLILLSRGKAMSGAPIKMGVNQFPNPPIIAGITIKKIMMKAWDVTIVLKIWSL